jgi:chromosome segregation ATPase
MTPENDVNVAQPEVEDIEVEVTETDAPEQGASSSNDDELENYTKSVSKRINKLNARNRETEERAAQLEAALRQKEAEVHAYYQHATQAQQNLLAKEEETVEIKEREANELYKKAHASGDAELMSKADTLKSELALQKEKVRIAKQRQEQQINTQQQPQVQQAQPTQQVAPPSEKALNWKENNPWFDQNLEATAWAEHVHNTLAGEGYDLESDDYYNELSDRIYKVYPDLRSDNAEQNEDRPAVQRVASASVGSRQKTQGKENGVRFTKSEVETLQGLKPHGMSDEAWLKSVAKEKQRIANREVK